MNKYGFNRNAEETITELVEWDSEHKDNNSYIFADIYGGSVLGLVDLNTAMPNNKFDKGVFIRVNYDTLVEVDANRINNMLNETSGPITSMDLYQIVNQLFPGKKISFKVGNNQSLKVRDPNASRYYNRVRDFEIYIDRNFTHITKNKINLSFESRLKCEKLFPIKDNFSSKFKHWINELGEDIDSMENIDNSKFEFIRFLLNKEGVDNTIFLNMNKNNVRKINAIFNRVNQEKVTDILVSQKDLIDEIKGLMEDTSKILKDSWDSCVSKYGVVKTGSSPESGLKVSAKGIDFGIEKDHIDVNIVGETIRVHGSGWIEERNKPVLDRALAYIISLGNEHEQLQAKFEEKLLKAL
jgi:hypothetical protein